ASYFRWRIPGLKQKRSQLTVKARPKATTRAASVLGGPTLTQVSPALVAARTLTARDATLTLGNTLSRTFTKKGSFPVEVTMVTTNGALVTVHAVVGVSQKA